MQSGFIAKLLAKPAAAPKAVALEQSAIDLLADENIEMHDSALFDVVVEVDFYDGRRLRIPQEVWPADCVCPF